MREPKRSSGKLFFVRKGRTTAFGDVREADAFRECPCSSCLFARGVSAKGDGVGEGSGGELALPRFSGSVRLLLRVKVPLWTGVSSSLLDKASLYERRGKDLSATAKRIDQVI